MKISVALAAYKGEKFIFEQVSSILSQLGEGDELVISDDFPEGKTKDALAPFLDDSRVRLLKGPGRGVVANFGFALSECTGDIVFLSDQDDKWLPDKLAKMLAAFGTDTACVVSNAFVANAELEPTGETLFQKNCVRTGYLKNLIRNSYSGCCMAFRRELIQKALPFPEKIPMHDQWLGLFAEKNGGVVLIEEPLMLYRVHGGNVTGGKTTFGQKILWRVNLIRALIQQKRGI